MANYPQHRRGFSNDTSAPAAQQITDVQRLKGHSVTGGATPGTIKLCSDGDKIWGSIDYEDSGEIVIADMGEDIAFKNAGNAAISLGSRIVGATRTVNGTAVYGYVKPFTSAAAADGAATDPAAPTEAEIETTINAAVNAAVDAALKASGCVVDGGAATNTAGADVPADVRVAFNRCA